MWITVIAVLTVLILKSLIDWRRPSGFPPGPRGLPVIGNILDVKALMKETKFHAHALGRLADDYGQVVGIRLGIKNPIIIVSGRNAVTEMLNRPEFDGRPNGFLFKYRTGGVRKGVIFTDGNIWSDHRRFAVRTLRRFGFGKVTMEDAILRDAVTLTSTLSEKAEKGPFKEFHKLASLALINNLWSMLAGSNFDLEGNNVLMTKIVDAVSLLIKEGIVSGGIMNQLPFLRFVCPGLIGFTQLKERLRLVTNFFQDVIAEHQKTRVTKEPRDFIDVYLEEMERQKMNPTMTCFDEYQLGIVAKDLFSAGLETTSNIFTFIVAFMIVYPETQRKIHEEIDRVIGRERLPSLADRNRLPYLNATISEVTRLANIAATTVPHRATSDTTLLGYKIKKYYMLLANLRSVHMDKGHWGDPEVFRPERFINENGEFFEDSWIIPFGLGRRRCLGEALAKNNLLLFTTCLFQKLKFILPPGEPEPDLKGYDGFTIQPPELTVLIEKRY